MPRTVHFNSVAVQLRSLPLFCYLQCQERGALEAKSFETACRCRITVVWLKKSPGPTWRSVLWAGGLKHPALGPSFLLRASLSIVDQVRLLMSMLTGSILAALNQLPGSRSGPKVWFIVFPMKLAIN